MESTAAKPEKAEVCEGVLSVSEGGSLGPCPSLFFIGIALVVFFSVSTSSQPRLGLTYLSFPVV